MSIRGLRTDQIAPTEKLRSNSASAAMSSAGGSLRRDKKTPRPEGLGGKPHKEREISGFPISQESSDKTGANHGGAEKETGGAGIGYGLGHGRSEDRSDGGEHMSWGGS